MKIAVTGAAGMLGADVMAELMRRGHEAVGRMRADMDITDGAAAADALLAIDPDAVIHCAAYTAVDAAEKRPRELHGGKRRRHKKHCLCLPDGGREAHIRFNGLCFRRRGSASPQDKRRRRAA